MLSCPIPTGITIPGHWSPPASTRKAQQPGMTREELVAALKKETSSARPGLVTRFRHPRGGLLWPVVKRQLSTGQMVPASSTGRLTQGRSLLRVRRAFPRDVDRTVGCRAATALQQARRPIAPQDGRHTARDQRQPVSFQDRPQHGRIPREIYCRVRWRRPPPDALRRAKFRPASRRLVPADRTNSEA
jgi:hypothetical protein